MEPLFKCSVVNIFQRFFVTEGEQFECRMKSYYLKTATQLDKYITTKTDKTFTVMDYTTEVSAHQMQKCMDTSG